MARAGLTINHIFLVTPEGWEKRKFPPVNSDVLKFDEDIKCPDYCRLAPHHHPMVQDEQDKGTYHKLCSWTAIKAGLVTEREITGEAEPEEYYSTENTGGEMANEQQVPEATTGTGVLTQVEETVAAKYGLQIREMEKEHEYNLLRVEADTKIKGQAMQESFSRLMRTMFLRQTKERLKEAGLWSRYCQDTGIDIKKADYEIDKLGEFRDETLLNFSAFCGYDINKIKYLTSGNSEKLGVTVQNGEIFVKGERVPLTPEDVQFVINTLQDDLRKQEEKAIKEKTDLEKERAETKKSLKKAERELKKIKGDAEKRGISPEEVAFLAEMDEIKGAFDHLIQRIDDAGFNAGDVATPHMNATAKTLVEYMKQRVAELWVQEA